MKKTNNFWDRALESQRQWYAGKIAANKEYFEEGNRFYEKENKRMAKSGKGSGLTKELKCSDELQELIGVKKVARGQMMKLVWKYIKKKGLQGDKEKGEDGRVIKLDKRLEPVMQQNRKLKKLIKEKRSVEMRGKKIKIPIGHVYMTELASGLNDNIS